MAFWLCLESSLSNTSSVLIFFSQRVGNGKICGNKPTQKLDRRDSQIQEWGVGVGNDSPKSLYLFGFFSASIHSRPPYWCRAWPCDLFGSRECQWIWQEAILSQVVKEQPTFLLCLLCLPQFWGAEHTFRSHWSTEVYLRAQQEAQVRHRTGDKQHRSQYSIHESLSLLYTISTQYKLVKVEKIEKEGKEPLPGEVQEGGILAWTLSLAQQEVSQQVWVGIAFCSHTALSSAGSGSPAKSLQVIDHLLNSTGRAKLGRGLLNQSFKS